MIDLAEVEDTIAKLETVGTSLYAVERLAWLYVVRDHLRSEGTMADREPLSGSEFVEAATAAPYREMMAVLDEHMEALKLVQPREYEAVMSRLRAL